MNIDMVPVELIGLKPDLDDFIRTLRRLGVVHIEPLAEAPEASARQLNLDRESLRALEELRYLVARLEGILDVLGEGAWEKPAPPPEDCLEEARAGVAHLLPKVQELTARREGLHSEFASLPRYEATLRKLLPIIPEAARQPQMVTVGVLVSRAHVAVLDTVSKQALDLTGGRAEVVASDVDPATRALLIVFPTGFRDEIEALLGREDVSRLRLPAELGEGPPDVVLAALHRRMSAIPEEIQQVEQHLAGLAVEWSNPLALWRDVLRDHLDAQNVLSDFGETDATFVVAGWVPAAEFSGLSAGLKDAFGEHVLIRRLPLTPELKARAPVSLRNPPPARPFESLVALLALPSYGRIDPARLMAFFLPFFFGMILGDVGYGALLLLIGFLAMRRMKPGVLHDVMAVLSMGAGWAILFGFLYGEAFGTLGESLGLHPLWFDRTGSEHVASLLLMTLAVGAVHITLGLVLGVWEALQEKSRSHLLERGGMLVGLISLFVLVGVLANVLPAGLRTPAWAGLVLGIVLLGASLGWLGLLMGPIEFIGLIGNVLSYLRIAAIGLASVYLAKVANDVAGTAGSVVVGAILAVLIHALNLVLGAFSPMIHSLRLHYVEFFRKFYEGGGRPYRPFRSTLSG